MTRLRRDSRSAHTEDLPCWSGDPAFRLARSGDFRDFVNHELRTPLTAAGTALQTLALQMERTGGRSRELVELALRNVRRLERSVEWAADYLQESPDASGTTPSVTLAVADLVADLDDLATDLSWATDAGDWEVPVTVDRGAWRRLLRQVVQALHGFAGERPLHLDLSLVPELDGPDACGLLLVGRLPAGVPHRDGTQRRTEAEGAADEPAAEDVADLQRLLALAVNPDLAARLGLRLDVVCLTGHLRLRLLLPLALAESALQTT